MLTINNVHYKSINQASKATGLTLNQLKRRYFTSGKGTIGNFDIVFDDAQDINVSDWIAQNYNTLIETVKKYYEYDDDLFQDCIIYLITKANEGLVKNYEQAFYNRYRGAVLDVKRATSKNLKIQAQQSYKPTANDEFDDFDYEFKQTRITIVNESFYDDEGVEVSICDLMSESIWDSDDLTPEITSVNELVKLDCIKEVLYQYFKKNQVDFYLDTLNKVQMRGIENSLVEIAKQYGITKKEVTRIRKEIELKLKEPDIINEINRLYQFSKYHNLDDSTLKDFIS